MFTDNDPYDPTEQTVVLDVFRRLLAVPTRDGGTKRAQGKKPPWWRDSTHEPALFSHLSAWKRGVARDPDSGAHPLVHLAWRALAIAYQETYGRCDPEWPVVKLALFDGPEPGRP